MKNLLIAASLVAVGTWYFHRVIDDRAHATQPEEQQRGEIVIANAPDGSLQGRWPSPAPTPARAK